jgi:hypothetical protein
MSKKNISADVIKAKHRSYYLTMMRASKAGNDALVSVKQIQMQTIEALLNDAGVEFNPEYENGRKL